jgi:hypothetical protein
MDTQAEPLDLILLPGVAFDEDCNRVSASGALSYGEDKLIRSWEGERRITTVSWGDTRRPTANHYLASRSFQRRHTRLLRLIVVVQFDCERSSADCAVALALSPQILLAGERVPTTPNDFQLDGVISPEGVIWRKGVKPENKSRGQA